MELAEAIEMARTQNIDAKLRIDPQVLALIGRVAAPGVGSPLQPYVYSYLDSEQEVQTVNLPQAPFKVQLGMKGRRVKDTQYGQIPAQG